MFRQYIGEVAHVHGCHAFVVQPFYQVADERVLCVVAASCPLSVEASNTATAVPALTEFGLQAGDLLGGIAEAGEQVAPFVKVLLTGRGRTGDE